MHATDHNSINEHVFDWKQHSIHLTMVKTIDRRQQN